MNWSWIPGILHFRETPASISFEILFVPRVKTDFPGNLLRMRERYLSDSKEGRSYGRGKQWAKLLTNPPVITKTYKYLFDNIHAMLRIRNFEIWFSYLSGRSLILIFLHTTANSTRWKTTRTKYYTTKSFGICKYEIFLSVWLKFDVRLSALG